MANEGLCVFSGHSVPRGSGLIRVANDTRAFLFKNRKVRALSARKANPRAVKWTAASRVFHKKGTKRVVQKEAKLRVVKEIRGFPSVPRALVTPRETPPSPRGKKPRQAAVHPPPQRVSKAQGRRRN